MQVLSCLIFGFLPAWGAVDRAPVEKYMKNYVQQVAAGKTTGLEDDGEDFATCLKKTCKVVFRKPIALKNEDEEDENAPEIFEVQMDVEQSGQVVARRSGCYILERKDGQLELKDYRYECAE